MAVRFDAVGDELNRTANLPPNSSFTYMMWAAADANTAGTWEPYLFTLNGSFTDGYALGIDRVAERFSVEVYDGGTVVRSADAASRPSLGAPHCVYLRCSGTGTNLLQGGYRTADSNTWVTATTTLGAIDPVTLLYMGGVLGAYWINGRRWNIKVWDRALSDAELLIESQYKRPMFPSSLNLWIPLDSSSDTNDKSGNGRNPTVSGTLTTQDGPVNLWVPRRKIILPASVVATTHDASGALSGQGASVVGSANRTRVHPSSGALSGQGSTVDGSAARTRVHPSSGVLSGQGSEVAGSAARTRVHPSSGVLEGQGAEIVGSADHEAPAGSHDATGDLVGQGSEIAGSALHTPNHQTSGVLQGQGSAVSGSASRFRAFAASGALQGQGAQITGSANRAAEPTAHDTSGVLVGPGSAVNGQAALPRRRRAAGGRRRIYIIKGQKYLLDERELAQMLVQLQTEVKRAEVKREGKKPKVLSNSTWAKLQESMKALEVLTTPPAEPEDEDDDELMLLMY